MSGHDLVARQDTNLSLNIWDGHSTETKKYHRIAAFLRTGRT
ncbi:hypothetical protein [Krasilnikovia sp. MM14-A1259]